MSSAALSSGLKIIFCVGEHIEECRGGEAVSFVSAQIQHFIPAVPDEMGRRCHRM
jgi:triosephosphate isomerase